MKKDLFIKRLNEVYDMVEAESALAEQGKSGKPQQQLRLILRELDNMRFHLNPRAFAPYYPRGIADSWEFQDELGAALLELAELYHKLRFDGQTT